MLFGGGVLANQEIWIVPDLSAKQCDFCRLWFAAQHLESKWCSLECAQSAIRPHYLVDKAPDDADRVRIDALVDQAWERNRT